MHEFAEAPVVSETPRARVPTGESLVVLTRDPALVEILQVLGSEHPVAAVSAESDLPGELLAKQTGVAILDAGAASSPIGQLTGRLKEQFPDLVLIVAGRLDDQTALAAQITQGTVYRFLHKPVSEQRVRLFVEAAWRRHEEELSGIADSTASPGALPDERRPLPRNTLLAGGLVLALLVGSSAWLMLRRPAATAGSTPPPPEASLPDSGRDEQLETLLARAGAALAAGALVAPPSGNAADLYMQALRRNGADPRAAAGVEQVIDRLLSAAEAQLAAQHLDEAQKLTDQARAIKADHVRVAFVDAQIGKERERRVLAQARQAASSGNFEQAIAVLDGARDGKHSALVAEARQQLERRILDERVSAYLAQASDRMGRGQLVEPAQDNARFFIESARALAPNQPDVRQAGRQLDEQLIAQARQALAAGNAEQAQRWIDAAADSGVSRDQLSELTRETERVRSTAKADAMARLPEAAPAGVDGAGITASEHDTTGDDLKRADEMVPAANLELARYSTPTFPISARERGVSGWVELQFLVRSDGSVSDIVVTGAQPVGVFEQAAVDAVRKWRYKPVQRDGHVVDQRARLRMKFALDK